MVLLIIALLVPLLMPSRAFATEYYEIFSDNFNNSPIGPEWKRFYLPGHPSTSPPWSTTDWNINSGKLAVSFNQANADGGISVQNPNWKDYIFETTINQNLGQDVNVVFRYLDILNWYGLHANNNGIYVEKFINGSYSGDHRISQFDFHNNKAYRWEISITGQELALIVRDGPLEVVNTSYTFSSPTLNSGGIGFRAATGLDSNLDITFDDVLVKVTNLVVLPSPSPTPSPTPTPTPMPVPYLNQTSDPWGSEEYNHASSWVPLVSNFLFSRWGCAVTSAAMVMRFHGVELGPSGQTTDPQSLNSWLKSQPDGYFGNGNTNWIALTRYTRQAKETYPSQPNLEFTSSSSTQTSDLDLELEATRPAILRVNNDLGGTHFLVATGKQPPTYSINDPYYPSRIQLSDYANSFTGIRKFSKSETDLSHLFFLLDQPVDLSLSESNGNTDFPLLFRDVEPPLGDPENGESSGKTLYSLGLPKPLSGTYLLTLSTATPAAYLLSSYIYDINAQVTLDQIPGILTPGNPETIKINFDKSSAQNSQTDKETDYASLKTDLEEAINLGLIKNRRLARSLLSVINRAEKLHRRNLHEAEKKLLQTLSALLKGPIGSILAEPEALQILILDIEQLKLHTQGPQ